MLPYSLLLNLTLCMSVEPFSESCRLHLGLHDAVAERPAFAGDTFSNRILVESVRNTARGDASVIRTRHVLINQRGERVFSLTKMSYFDPVAPACVGAIEPGAVGGDFAAAAAPARSLRERMIESNQTQIEVDEPEDDSMALLMGAETADKPQDDDMSEEKLLRALMEAQGQK